MAQGEGDKLVIEVAFEEAGRKLKSLGKEIEKINKSGAGGGRAGQGGISGRAAKEDRVDTESMGEFGGLGMAMKRGGGAAAGGGGGIGMAGGVGMMAGGMAVAMLMSELKGLLNSLVGMVRPLLIPLKHLGSLLAAFEMALMPISEMLGAMQEDGQEYVSTLRDMTPAMQARADQLMDMVAVSAKLLEMDRIRAEISVQEELMGKMAREMGPAMADMSEAEIQRTFYSQYGQELAARHQQIRNKDAIRSVVLTEPGIVQVAAGELENLRAAQRYMAEASDQYAEHTRDDFYTR